MPVSLLEIQAHALSAIRIEGPALCVAQHHCATRIFPLRHLQLLIFRGQPDAWLATLGQAAMRGCMVIVVENDHVSLVMQRPGSTAPRPGPTLAYWERSTPGVLSAWVVDQCRHLLGCRTIAPLPSLTDRIMRETPYWLQQRADAVLRATLIKHKMPADACLLNEAVKTLLPLLLLELNSSAQQHMSAVQQSRWMWRADLVARCEALCQRLCHAALEHITTGTMHRSRAS